MFLVNQVELFLKKNPRVTDVLVFLLGALLPLSFAPINIIIFAVLSPAGLLLILRTRQHIFWRGWLYGFGYFTVGVSWIFISIHFFGGTPIWLAAIFTLLFTATLGLFIAGFTFFFVRFFSTSHTVALTLGFACCWVLQEILRTYLFTGFPWLLLGTTQTNTLLKNFAPLIGVYGISFICVLFAGLLINAIFSRTRFILSISTIILILVVGWLLSFKPWTTPIHQPLTVNLIQGNIAQSIKWQPSYLKEIMGRYQNLTATNWNADLIVWPEGAIPDIYSYHNSYFQNLYIEANQHNTSIAAGVFLSDANEQRYYNSVIIIGKGSGQYSKRHLVPFGEYVPFAAQLRGLIQFFDLPMSALSPGDNQQPLLQVKDNLIAAYLCYEVAYPNLIRNNLPAANLLLTMSDDSWFGKSWAGSQTLQIAQMRALETGREHILVGNDSNTAIIDSHGNILVLSKHYQEDIIHGQVQPYSGSTPWVEIGGMPEFILLILLTLGCMIIDRK
jgi:apolipoprotein N-acyltransferase